MTPWRVQPMGEAALLIECLLDDVAVANAHALALSARLPADWHPLPAIRSVLIRFDPLRDAQDEVLAHVRRALVTVTPDAVPAGRQVVVPVRYGGEDGPDLEDAARQLGLTPDELIAQHTAQPWRVLMIGFAPGFPYIGPLPASLHLPRRATPRAAVPAGSVAIAAGMTGIYPARLPGGWHLIGRTPLALFDPMRDSPALLRPGDHVQFIAAA
ncbi:MAG: 5-oxoprolinase subunit PxpB [Thermoflexales bacterium]|nr:5-oxoprolinase subunit PxpB [Thermoflexales bacterium]MDW8352636.1 5-oxoprolinase subunit PxpB [Anaerolineae bacterium]